MLGSLDVHASVRREHRAITAHACGRNAIEKVHASSDALDQVLRKPDAHQVTRLVRGQFSVYALEDAIHVRLGLAHRETTDAEADPIVHAGDGANSLRAEVF